MQWLLSILGLVVLAVTMAFTVGGAGGPTPLPGTAQDHPALVTAVAQFTAAAETRRHLLVGELPPRVSEKAAGTAGIPSAVMHSLVKQLAERTAYVLPVERVALDLNRAPVANSNGLTFALLPTRWRQLSADKPTAETGISLAILDQGRWFIQFIDCEARIQQVRQAYPELSRVPLPLPTREASST